VSPCRSASYFHGPRTWIRPVATGLCLVVLSGRAIGATGGAVLGAVVGGNPAFGAAVGGAAGAAAGALLSPSSQ
jgi:hypothetical protein